MTKPQAPHCTIDIGTIIEGPDIDKWTVQIEIGPFDDRKMPDFIADELKILFNKWLGVEFDGGELQ